MKYPTRLIADKGELGELARSLLADSDMGEPPPAAARTVWKGVQAQLAQLPLAHVPHSGIVKAGASSVAIVKAGAIAVLIGGAGVTAALVRPSEHARTEFVSSTVAALRTTRPSVAPSSAVARRNVAPSTESEPVVPTAPRAPVDSPLSPQVAASVRLQPSATGVREPPPLPPTPQRERVDTPRARAGTTSSASVGSFAEPGSTGEAPKTKAPASQLLRETALLEQGRAALRAGNIGLTWKILEQWGAEFPVAQLNQEREALAIELLWQSGRKDLAQQRIRAFERDYPSSAHAARLKALLAP